MNAIRIHHRLAVRSQACLLALALLAGCGEPPTVHPKTDPPDPQPALAQYVIQISVDGLRPGDMQTLIDAGRAPNFARLQTEGAGANDARVDQTRSLPIPLFGAEKLVLTLPNHMSMMTGRPIERNNVLGDEVGHGYTADVEPPPGETVHHFRGAYRYKASTFDVAHDHGLRTALFAAKTKFDIFYQSWGRAGAPDRTGPMDNGRDKIDVYVVLPDAIELTEGLIEELRADPIHYTFLHYREPDSAGHASGWGSPTYLEAVRTVDAALGLLFELIDYHPTFAGRTALILTADHGGGGSMATQHLTYDNLRDARVPFYVWGPGVAAGRDLYELNPGVRYPPRAIEVLLSEPEQPFRNGDSGNLALRLLGLGPVAGSCYNFEQTIEVGPAGAGAGPEALVTGP